MKHQYPNKYELALILFVALSAITIGCTKKEAELPGANISGIRTSIQRILISPLAFDSAIVAVEGRALGIQNEISDDNQTITKFNITDSKGNYINVWIEGTPGIVEDDILIIGGVYRRSTNTIEAKQLMIIELEDIDK